MNRFSLLQHARHCRSLLAASCLGGAILTLSGAAATAATVRVSDVAGLQKAVAAARPGDRILIAPGQYAGGMHFRNVHGRPGAPIVIAGADARRPPLIRGGGNNIQLSEVSHLELRDMTLTGATGNGLNIDDGGTYETPSHHVTLRGLKVTDVGPSGNRDGIKLSGLDDFRVVGCTIERWGDGGCGIDMVGCHRGIIEGCTFRYLPGKGAAGVQAKGGSRDIVVRRCRFEHAGSRGVNIGGSTGLQFFRPPHRRGAPAHEAKDIRVEGNTFIGSDAPVAFVGVDGATVRFNTFYLPRRWALRILQETREPGFVPSRNGVFTDNLIVFRSEGWGGAANVGPNTDDKTFRFARNWWYDLGNPARSRPELPTPERNGVVGRDPQLVAPQRGDVRVKPGSPAARYGAGGLPQRRQSARLLEPGETRGQSMV